MPLQCRYDERRRTVSWRSNIRGPKRPEGRVPGAKHTLRGGDGEAHYELRPNQQLGMHGRVQGCIKHGWERWHPAGEGHFRQAGETPALPAGNLSRA